MVYDETGTGKDTLTGFELFSEDDDIRTQQWNIENGLQDDFIADFKATYIVPDFESSYGLNVAYGTVIDYSTSAYDLTFNLNRSDPFASGVTGKMGITVHNDLESPDTHSTSVSDIKAFIGNDIGNTAHFSNSGTFISGTGDDQVITRTTYGSIDRITYLYTGGEDEFWSSGGKTLTPELSHGWSLDADLQILMGNGILAEDVSVSFVNSQNVEVTYNGSSQTTTFSDILITVADKGTITIKSLRMVSSDEYPLQIVYGDGTVQAFGNTTSGSPDTTSDSSWFTKGTWGDNTLVSYDTEEETFYGYGGNDTIIAGIGRSVVYAGDGDDYVDAGGGADNTLYGGAGADMFVLNEGTKAQVKDYSAAENDVIQMADGATDIDNIGVSWSVDGLVLSTTTASIVLESISAMQDITTTVNLQFADDTILSVEIDQAGDIVGIEQADFTNESDDYQGSTGNDVVSSMNGNDNLVGGDGDDTLYGGAGDDTLSGGAGNDVLYGGTGADTYIYTADNDTIIESADEAGKQDVILLPEGVALEDLTFSRSGDNLVIAISGGGQITVVDQFAHGTSVEKIIFDDAEEFNLIHLDGTLEGTSGVDVLEGRDIDPNFLNDHLYGYAGDDTLTGGLGNDTLNGGSGADSLLGGAGDDLYIVDDAGDVVIENASEGADTVEASVSYTLSSNVENLTLTGTADIDATGNAANNTLVGNAGNNTLDGSTGADSLVGGAGNDVYIVDDAGDVVIENASEGVDTVEAGVSYTLSANVENLTLTGTANIDATGNAADNSLMGNSGANTLDGGAGNDYLAGGDGNDVYIVNEGFKTIVDTAGTDKIVFGSGLNPADLSLARINDNDLQISFDAVPVVVISGFYSGTSGIETLEFYDTSTLDLTDFQDITGTSGADVLAGADNALLTDDVIYGLEGNDTLDGGLGNDYLNGSDGDDTYAYNAGVDTISDSSGADTVVFASGFDQVDMSLVRNGATGLDVYFDDVLALHIQDQFTAGGKLETFDFNGMGTLDLSTVSHLALGTASADTLYGVTVGGSEDDTLDGAAGADTLYGYDGDNTLIGGLGNDTLYGGNDDDVYIYESGDGIDTIYDTDGSDRIVFGSGLDEVDMSVTKMNGSDLQISFNSIAVVLIKNHFVGDGQVETIEFADTSTFDLTAILTATLGTSGSDTLYGSTNVDIVDRLEGFDGTDYLYGYAGNDILNPGAGRDTMTGGTGDDTYVMMPGWKYSSSTASSNNRIIENTGEGTDTVHIGGGLTFDDVRIWTTNAGELVIQSELDAADIFEIDALHTAGVGSDVGSRVEYITFDDGYTLDLTGGLTLVGSTNEPNQNLYGSAGNDTLDARNGRDTMFGYDGDDTYVYLPGWGYGSQTSSMNNRVIEASGEGTDTVHIGGGVTPDDIYLWVNNTGELVVALKNNAVDTFEIDGTGSTTVATDVGTLVEYIRFDDGSIIDITGGLVQLGSDEGQTIIGTVYNDVIDGGAGNDYIYGHAGNDTLIDGAGRDSLYGGTGDDTYIFSPGFGHPGATPSNNIVVENSGEGTDTVIFTGGFTRQNVQIWKDAYGNTSVQSILNPNDAMTFNQYVEYLIFQDEDFVIDLTSGGQTIIDTDSSSTITGTAFDDYLDGNGGVDNITSYDGNDTLDGGTGIDTLTGGLGDDLYIVDNVNDIVNELSGQGTDTVESDVSYTLSANVENLILTGAGALDGTGNAENNTLTGNDSVNTLDGGAGADTLIGGLGDDVYIVDDAGDVVVEAADEGIDTVESSVSHTLAGNVENLILTGSGNIDGTGNADANTLTGNSGTNTLTGGAGDDTYIVGTGDVVVEATDEGEDTVQSDASYTLGAHIENLILTGSSNIDGTGNAENNTLTGNSGTNTLTGGLGDDTYIVGTGDVVVEAASEGTDTVESDVSYTLSTNIENLVLTGTGNINGTGNAENNTLTGNSGTNTLTGGAGDDTYIVGTGDVVVEAASEGTDTVESDVSYTLSANVENLVLTGAGALDGTGNAENNTLIGNDSVNTLDGGAGADTLIGGLGDDVYIVDDAGDVVVEAADEGTDTVESSVSHTLASNVENLILTGSGNIDGTGNADANTLTGNSGTNTLTGGAGDDTYIVGTGDVVVEATDEGEDTVQSDASYTLGAHIENLILTGSSNIDGTGNAENNTLTGNSGTNTLTGGLGDDTYIVGTGDVVVEAASEGTDTVESDVSYTLSTNIENLVLTGTGNINGTGNAENNTLTGNSGNNTLDGAGGLDTLIGGFGNDVYIVNSATDILIEGASEGIDIVHASLSWTLGDHFEGITLTGSSSVNATGNDLDNILIGNAGNNTLIGGGGNDTLEGLSGLDTLIGGLGDDLYIVSDSEDEIVENSGEGMDTVQSSISWVLDDHFENLTLSGIAGINGTGNGLDNILVGNNANNVLTGNGGNDTIDGGIGRDTMIGGTGDDVYFVERSKDQILEEEDEGIDTVYSSATYSLRENIENLILTGVYSRNGHGNGLDNLIIGNEGANVLSGRGGNDTLDGGVGNDALYGDAGDDLYIYNSGIDRINDRNGGGTDTLHIEGDITINDLQVSKKGHNANIEIDADNAIVVVNHHYSSGYTLDNIRFDDGFLTTFSDYQSWNWGTSGADTLTGTSGHDTIIGMEGDDDLDGAGGADNIHGGSGNDIIRGGDSSDLLHGGLGDDILFGDAGADTIFGGDGADTFTFEAATAYSGIDIIKDFSTSEGDTIDLLDVLDGIYDEMTDDLLDFVQLSESAGDTLLSIDRDGTGMTYGWTQIASIQGVTGLGDADAMVTAGQLLVA